MLEGPLSGGVEGRLMSLLISRRFQNPGFFKHKFNLNVRHEPELFANIFRNHNLSTLGLAVINFGHGL